MRERLIEMIQDATHGCAKNWVEVVADHLIENGLIIKSEAIKEFADKLKNKMIAKHRNIDGFCVYEVDDEQIDNLVKEMVEGD